MNIFLTIVWVVTTVFTCISCIVFWCSFSSNELTISILYKEKNILFRRVSELERKMENLVIGYRIDKSEGTEDDVKDN